MVFKTLKEDLDAFVARDPAARSRIEVFLCYPGLHAVIFHRASHALWRRKFHLLARILSQINRFLTAVEIHPGAQIGRRVVIDHGQGVVIGETANIEDDVTLYQGVTLGGISPAVDSRNQVSLKRHPTLKSGVIIGSGAQVLGPITIGERARVGANSVVTRDVCPGATAVGIPAHAVMPRDRTAVQRFSAYGTPAEGCPDPILASIENLRQQMTALISRLGTLEERLRALDGIAERVDGSPPPLDMVTHLTTTPPRDDQIRA
jgi:serine O-acetyltransferase